MRPNLDTATAAELPKARVRPVFLSQIALNSGVERVWSGVGPLTWNGKTYSGLGELVSLGGITENSEIQAAGTTVTLAFAQSQLDIPDYPVTPPSPPRPPVTGESVAWSFATSAPPTASFSNPSGIFNGFHGCSGSCSGTRTSGAAFVTNGQSLGQNSIEIAWSGYKRPLAIPAGARITAVIPYIEYSVDTASGGNISLACFYPGGSELFAGGGGAAADVHTLAGVYVRAFVQTTNPGAVGVTGIDVTFVGLAVYYEGSPLTTTSLVYEALNDVRLGAPVKIWFGFLKDDGTFAGQPYLIFKGSVDQPSVKLDPAGSSITLALESRMANLQRASNAKYTAADQQLKFPTDMFYNWVEILQEISLKQGA